MRKARTLSPAQQRRLERFMARTWESPPMAITEEHLSNQETAVLRMSGHDRKDTDRRMIACENFYS